jgi:hypothetical protein
MQKLASFKEYSYEYIETEVEENRQWEVLQLGIGQKLNKTSVMKYSTRPPQRMKLKRRNVACTMIKSVFSKYHVRIL